MKKYVLLLSGIIFCFYTSYTQTIITGGEVSGTWTSSNSPYWIQGNIEVPTNSNLTIEPGTYIEFQGHYKLDVKGVLSAVGSLTDTIFFTIDDTTNFFNIDIPEGGWSGIELTTEYNQDTSLLAYCDIKYTKPLNTTSTDYHGRAVTLFNGNNIRITNCRLTYNKGHLLGGAVGSLENSYIYMANNVIQNCESTWGGGGVQCIGSIVDISNNIFYNNKAYYDGGSIVCANSTVYLSNNLISNNQTTQPDLYGKGGGVRLSNCDAFIVNNIICNNYSIEGGGIYCHNGNYTLINNTIANNQAFETGGGIYTNYFAEVELLNSIMWGNIAINGTQVYDGGNTTVAYCDIQGGFYGIENIDSDPEFILPSLFYGPNYDGLNANWELKCYSPCINSGSPDVSLLPDFDFNNNPRVVDLIVDMGAFEYQYDNTPLIIDGNVTYNGNNVTAGYVKLFEYAYKTRMPVIDSVVISDSGFYQFEAVCHGQYIVCAYPEANLYPEALRTYLGDTYYWEYATIIDFSDDTATYSADINLIELEVSVGFNSLSGTIQSDELNPMLGIDALLEIPPDNVLRYRQTNSNGTYEFLSVPNGYYRILVDIPGLPMDSIHEVSFSENKLLSKESFNYLVNDSIIYIDETTQIESLLAEKSVQIIPNPCRGQFTILEPDNYNQEFQIQIIDLNGKIWIKRTVNSNTIVNCQVLPAGCYFVEFTSDDINTILKLLIL